MKQFPERLNVKNKEKFAEFNYERNKCYMRKEIYELMIKGDENDYYVIDDFARKYLKNDMTIALKMIEEIMNELNNLGWKTKISYGGTALFIYSTNEAPVSCYEDGF